MIYYLLSSLFFSLSIPLHILFLMIKLEFLIQINIKLLFLT